MNLFHKLKDQGLALARKVGILSPEQPNPSDKTLVVASVIVGLCLISLGLMLISPLNEEDVSADFGELPDFSAYTDINEMKADFFDYLQPMVEYHNRKILEQREQLEGLYGKLEGGGKLRSRDKSFVTALAEEYEYELAEDWDEQSFNPVYRQLMLRVDEVPIDLALVQAAKESGWGRSRFALEANNLFGQWCYTSGCGLVPANRSADAIHEVQKFDSVVDAISSYMKNLNSHPSYDTLRLIRAGLRSADSPVTGAALADGLIYYSQRREAYVDDIKTMIRQYHQAQSSPASES